MIEPDERSSGASHLLVRVGGYVCALPLAAVRRVVRALTLHPLPGSAAELKGLAEYGGEPLPVLDLARLVRAPQGANPAYPVTVVVWAGPPEARELVGLAADAALELARLPASAQWQQWQQADTRPRGGGTALLPESGSPLAGFVAGEAVVGGEVVRVVNLEALGGLG
ncbi:MAG TPA: chemotaxis protein CheW [Thermoanaerobaculia bacterium]|nr:chemotaxis protein CheW [Thermoanaerobaculia bacterium]